MKQQATEGKGPKEASVNRFQIQRAPRFVLLLLFCCLFALLPFAKDMASTTASAAGAVRFIDLESSYWGNSYIEFAASHGIINGYPLGDGRFEFHPEAKVTKEEAMTMLYHTLEAAGKLNTVEDLTVSWQTVLDNNHVALWAQKYVAYGLTNGIIEETELATFVTQEIYGVPASREQIAVWAAKATNARMTPVYGLEYLDLPSISQEALPYVDLLYRHGVMRGDDTGNFHPQDGVKRVEFAAVCNRIFDSINNGQFDLSREQFSLRGTIVSVDLVRHELRMMLSGGTVRTVRLNPKTQIVIDGKRAYNGIAGITAGTSGIVAYGAFCMEKDLNEPGDNMQCLIQTQLLIMDGVVSQRTELGSDQAVLQIKNAQGENTSYLLLNTTKVLNRPNVGASVRFLSDGVKLLEIK